MHKCDMNLYEIQRTESTKQSRITHAHVHASTSSQVLLGLTLLCNTGSMIQPWMSPAALAMCLHAKAVGPESPFSQSQMYNAMINPLLKVQPAAVLWHQGEENAGNPVEYRCFFSAMIKDWRSQFHLPSESEVSGILLCTCMCGGLKQQHG